MQSLVRPSRRVAAAPRCPRSLRSSRSGVHVNTSSSSSRAISFARVSLPGRAAPVIAWSRASSRSIGAQVAHFSSAPSPHDDDRQLEPLLLSGFGELQQTLRRCRNRKDVFQRYASSQVFQPSRLALLNNWFLFYHLNRPQNTHLDLDMVEFLDGAKQALESTMLAMYSREFANFAAGAIPSSPMAEQLNGVLEPVSLDALKEFIRYTEHSGIRTELVKLDVHAAYLVGAIYDRVPRRPNRTGSGNEVVGVPVDERLRIQVCFEITEHVNVKLPEEMEPELMKKDNAAIWQFESLVTTLDALDWRIEPLNMVSN